jgi:ABC-type branched-subunit amino acid transport system substrate-binding protein
MIPRRPDRPNLLVTIFPFLIATAIAMGCSATRFEHQLCTDGAQCRKAFGFGAVCSSDGFCEAARPSARCNTSFPEDLFSRPEVYRDAIVIGSLMDRSSASHLVREKSVRMAIKELSDAGGIAGRPVAAVFCDIAEKAEYDQQKPPAIAVSCATFLSGTLGVKAVVGPSGSADTQKVWEATRQGLVVISPAATSPSLVRLEPPSSDAEPGFLWRVAPPDSGQGTVIAQDMLQRQVKSAAVILEMGPYGEGLAQIFQQRFTAGGGSVDIYPIPANADTSIGEMTAKVAASSAAEVLFISSKQDWVIKFLNAASGQRGYETKGIFLTDAAANEGVLLGASAASALFRRVRGTRPAPRDRQEYVFASFVANYKAQYMGQDPTTATFSDHSYDGAWLAFSGAAWSLLQEGEVTAPGIGRGLRRVSSGPLTVTIPSSWPVVINAFRGGNSIDLSGASGEITFDAVTRNVTANIEVWTVGPPEGGRGPTILSAGTRATTEM